MFLYSSLCITITFIFKSSFIHILPLFHSVRKYFLYISVLQGHITVILFIKAWIGTSLVAQWLEFRVLTAKGPGPIPDVGTKIS